MFDTKIGPWWIASKVKFWNSHFLSVEIVLLILKQSNYSNCKNLVSRFYSKKKTKNNNLETKFFRLFMTWQLKQKTISKVTKWVRTKFSEKFPLLVKRVLEKYNSVIWANLTERSHLTDRVFCQDSTKSVSVMTHRLLMDLQTRKAAMWLYRTNTFMMGRQVEKGVCIPTSATGSIIVAHCLVIIFK